jgi:ribosomal protein S18 acetylase RimI-like enzyme
VSASPRVPSAPSPGSTACAPQPRVTFAIARGEALAWALASLDAPEIVAAFGAPRSLGLATLLAYAGDAGPTLLVASDASGRRVGLAVAYGLDGRRIELALAVPDPTLRRRGLGVACADALLGLVFDVWGADALVLRVHRDNRACRALLARFGPLEAVGEIGAFTLYVVPAAARGALVRPSG